MNRDALLEQGSEDVFFAVVTTRSSLRAGACWLPPVRAAVLAGPCVRPKSTLSARSAHDDRSNQSEPLPFPHKRPPMQIPVVERGLRLQQAKALPRLRELHDPRYPTIPGAGQPRRVCKVGSLIWTSITMLASADSCRSIPLKSSAAEVAIEQEIRMHVIVTDQCRAVGHPWSA